MRIKYKILWVDDRKDEFERLSYDKRIIEYVKNLFFEPHLTFCETVEEAKDIISHNHFDVIFSDYNINDGSSGEQGDGFISYIRSRNVNTEVLFYSAMKELPTLKLNRIVFFSLAGLQDGYRKLLEQMEGLIYLTTEKLHDLTALRGLVMAEVSELDVLMEQIILAYFNSPERMRTFHDHITANREETWHKMLNSSTQCDKQCFHIWREKDLTEYVSKLDSSQKARAINIVLSDIDSAHAICTDSKFFKNYDDSIILNRNNLAHCISEKDKNGNEILKTWKGEKIYNDEEFRIMRANIIKYHNMFTTLLTTLTASE